MSSRRLKSMRVELKSLLVLMSLMLIVLTSACGSPTGSPPEPAVPTTEPPHTTRTGPPPTTTTEPPPPTRTELSPPATEPPPETITQPPSETTTAAEPAPTSESAIPTTTEPLPTTTTEPAPPATIIEPPLTTTAEPLPTTTTKQAPPPTTSGVLPPAPAEPLPTTSTEPPNETSAEPPALPDPTEPPSPSITESPPRPGPVTGAPGAGPPTDGPPLTTERQQLLDRQRSFLRDGRLVYRPPSPMRVNEWKRVVVRISDSSAPPDFEEGLPGSGPVRPHDVKVGSDLIAEITSPDFEIVRVGSDDGRRTLATETFAEWQWDVRPLRSGQRELSLVLYVRLTDDSGSPLDVKTFVEKIEVEVNPVYTASQWVKSYWPATGLTVPVIVAAVWAVIRRRRNAVAPDTAGSEPTDVAPTKVNRPRNKRSRRSRPATRRRRPN